MKNINTLREAINKHLTNILMNESNNTPWGAEKTYAPWRDTDDVHIESYEIDYENNQFVVFANGHRYEVSFDDFTYSNPIIDVNDEITTPSEAIQKMQQTGHDFTDELENMLSEEIQKDVERYNNIG